MMAAGIAPNLGRRFGFEKLYDYDPGLHQQERERLTAGQSPAPEGLQLLGLEIDPPTFRTLRAIRAQHFPNAPIRIENRDFRGFDPGPGFRTAVCNPPYGIRSGEEEEIAPLYRDLGSFLNRHVAGGRAAIYTVNHAAAPLFGGDPDDAPALLNGSLEGRLYRFSPQCP
jgi:putative N6-adenine-specific DNA methylase